ncbi:DMT family protein [Legionella jordanis]|nr:DMT family protein [Legionella jordanis]
MTNIIMIFNTTMKTILLLIASNFFMTFAWYGHLKTLNNKPVYLAILVSWSIAFFEYLLQVPANRIGYRQFDLAQLKIIQEIITMCVFACFAYYYMNKPLGLNFLCAGLCMIGAAYFVFKN